MAKKVLTLDYQEEFDFLLLGIISPYRDYQVCHEINKVLGTDFERQDDFILQLERKGTKGVFSVFQYRTEDGEDFFLLANKGNSGLFISAMKHIDYFMMIRNHSRYTDIQELSRKIKSPSVITSVLILDPPSVKAAENFLYIEYTDPEMKRDKENKDALNKL